MKIRVTITSELTRRFLVSLGTGRTRLLPAPAAGGRGARPLPAPAPRAGKAGFLPAPEDLLGPAGITVLLWLTSPNQVSIIQSIAAFLLLLFPWWSFRHWQKTRRPGLPLFSAVAAMYWLFFAVPLFWGNRMALSWRNPTRQVGDAAVTETMLLVVLGVICLWSGIKSGFGRRTAPQRFPDIAWKPLTLIYLWGIAAAGTIMSAYGSLATAGGEGSRQILQIIEGTVSLTAILILLRRTMDGKAGTLEKTLVMVILGVRVMLGLASGWVGSAVALGLSCALVYLHKHHKLPIAMLACLLPYVLFFQAAKREFRNTFWYNQMEAGAIEKAEFWVEASLKAWQAAFDDPSGSGIGTLISYSSSRTSLLSSAANVIEQTPAVVPYQYGRLYSYLAVALVPRFLWPDKPSMNEANQFYQVAYGVTREQDLGAVSIAVGTLTEGYINFGWFGTALVMFLIGVLLDFWNETFLTGGTASLALGIGIALVPDLLLVEFQLAQYVSGIIQHVILTIVIFLPITRWSSAAVRNGAFGNRRAHPGRALRPAQ